MKFANNIIGKTVESVQEAYYSEFMVLTFTDGTFCEIKSCVGYESDVMPPEINEKSLACHDDLVKIGAITQKEADDRDRVERMEWEARQAANDLRNYEKLKIKLGKND